METKSLIIYSTGDSNLEVAAEELHVRVPAPATRANGPRFLRGTGREQFPVRRIHQVHP